MVANRNMKPILVQSIRWPSYNWADVESVRARRIEVSVITDSGWKVVYGILYFQQQLSLEVLVSTELWVRREKLLKSCACLAPIGPVQSHKLVEELSLKNFPTKSRKEWAWEESIIL